MNDNDNIVDQGLEVGKTVGKIASKFFGKGLIPTKLAGKKKQAAKAIKETKEDGGKKLLTASVAVLSPFLIIVMCLMAIGMAILGFLKECLDYIVENNDSYGNIDYDLTIGWLHVGYHLIDDALSSDDEEINAIRERLHEGNFIEIGGESASLGDGMSDEDIEAEMEYYKDKLKAERVMRKRIAMVQRSVDRRVEQLEDEASPFWISMCLEDNIDELIWNIPGADEAYFYLLDTPQLVSDGQPCSEYEALALLSAYSVQTDQQLEDITSYNFRHWLGLYSGIASTLFFDTTLNSPTVPTEEYDAMQVAVGNVVLAFPESGRDHVAEWHGTFLPQYLYEELLLDATAHRIIENDPDNEEILATGRTTAGSKSYDTHGIINDIVSLEGVYVTVDVDIIEISEAESWLYTKYRDLPEPPETPENPENPEDPENPEEPTEPEEPRTYACLIIHPAVHIDVNKKTPDDIVTNIIGFWRGDIDSVDENGNNRDFSNAEHPNLLAANWTDSRGATYSRQQGNQYEYWRDSIQCIAKEYNIGLSGDWGSVYSSGGAAMAAEARRIYEAFHENQALARTYVWSEYYGSPSTSNAAWCCAFVSVCAKHCGFLGEGKALGPITAWCPTSWNYFEKKNLTHRDPSYIPKPGDLIYYNDDGEDDQDHIGIVEYYENGIVHTIEGNSLATHEYNAAVGSWVYENRTIYGYASPEYPDAENFRNSVSVYYSAGYNPSYDAHEDINGKTVFGPYNATIDDVYLMLDNYLAGSVPDIAARFADTPRSVDTYAAKWNEVRNELGDRFDGVMFDAFYYAVAKPYFDYLKHETEKDFNSNIVLREFAFAVLSREHTLDATNSILELNIVADTPPEGIVSAYYANKLAALENDPSIPAEKRAILRAVLRNEQRLLNQIIDRINNPAEGEEG